MTIRNIRPEQIVAIGFALVLFLSLACLGQAFGAPEASLSVLHEETATEPAVKRWLCDIDGDGRAELFSDRMGKVHNFIEVAHRKGSSFEPYWRSEELGFFHDAAAGDIDKDGVEELVAVGYSVRFNGDALLVVDYQDGEFRVSEYPLDYRTELVAIGDVTNNGENEIVTVRIDYRQEESSRETILVNQMSADGLIEIDASTGHTMIADVYVDDFDGDGVVELLVAESKGDPVGAHGGLIYTPFLNVYRWDSEGLSAQPALTKEGFVGMPYPRITVRRTPEGKRILFWDNVKLSECYMQDNTISDPVEILKPPEGIVTVSCGDIDGNGSDSLVVETWTYDHDAPKVRGAPGRGALRIYAIAESPIP